MARITPGISCKFPLPSTKPCVPMRRITSLHFLYAICTKKINNPAFIQFVTINDSIETKQFFSFPQQSPADLTVLPGPKRRSTVSSRINCSNNIPQLHLLLPHHLRPRSAPLPIAYVPAHRTSTRHDKVTLSIHPRIACLIRTKTSAGFDVN